MFNVGNDEHLALREIAEAVVAPPARAGSSTSRGPSDRDAIDIGSYFGDSSKAKRMLDWSPETHFADGIARTVDFYRRHLDWYL